MSMVEGATPLMYACQQGKEKEVRDILLRKPHAAREKDRTGKTALHYCAENINTKCAEAVVSNAPDFVNCLDEDGYSPLHLAVISGNKPFIQLLITSGADVNALDNEQHSIVHWATVCGEDEALETVLRAGATISCPDMHGGFPLHYAAQMCGAGAELRGDPRAGVAVLRTLLAYGAQVDARDKDGRQPILWAASADGHSRDPRARFRSSGSAEAILALVKAGAKVEASDKDGLTALHCAASRGHTDCLETLVALCGAHVDTIDINGCTALFYAVTLGHADATQLLLNLGAEPNRQDRKGRTPAHCGAAKGQLETLRILLSGGSNLWLRNVKGDVPLHEAVASGRRELVTWLLNQRPDAVNVANNDGKCPVHVAAINNYLDIIKVLLDAGSLVNPVLRSNRGEMLTPLDAALARGHRSTAKYLQMHGGVPRTKLTEVSAALRGTMPSRETSEVGLAMRIGPTRFDMYPIQCSQPKPIEKPDEDQISGGVSRVSSKKMRRRRSDRKKQSEGSTSEDSAASGSYSRHQRHSERRRKSSRSKRRKSKNDETDNHSSSDSNTDVSIKTENVKIVNSDSNKEKESKEQLLLIVDKDNMNKKRNDPVHDNLIENEKLTDMPDVVEVPLISAIAQIEHTILPTEVIISSDDANNVTKTATEAVLIASPVPSTDVPTSLDDKSPPLPTIIHVEAEVYQQVENDVPGTTNDSSSNSKETASDEMTPAIVTGFIEDNTTNPVQKESITSSEENKSELKNNGRMVHISSTDTSSSQAEDDLISNRPITARRRSVIEAKEKPEIKNLTETSIEKDNAFYALSDELNTERRSADGSEGFNNEDIPGVIAVVEDLEPNLIFGDSVNTSLRNDRVVKKSQSEARVLNGYESDEHYSLVHEIDIDTAIRDVILDDQTQRLDKHSRTSSRHDDSSGLLDSGIEPSPRLDGSAPAVSCPSPTASRRVPRVCQKGRIPSSYTPVSVTRAVQSTIRKYHLERKIFYQLLELKRLQIRAGRANEQVLVKRLVDDYQKAGGAVGLTLYEGNYSFRQFERFLYDQLHHLQAGRRPLIAKVNPTDDLESLSALLNRPRSEVRSSNEFAECADLAACTNLTHRCRHATHAYTGIPCAAYITKINHHTMPKNKKTGFLPQIHTTEKKRSGKSTDRPVTLEVINGGNKQVISLPTDHFDRSKRYFVTFTIKGSESPPRSRSPSSASAGHYHAKTV